MGELPIEELQKLSAIKNKLLNPVVDEPDNNLPEIVCQEENKDECEKAISEYKAIADTHRFRFAPDGYDEGIVHNFVFVKYYPPFRNKSIIKLLRDYSISIWPCVNVHIVSAPFYFRSYNSSFKNFYSEDSRLAELFKQDRLLPGSNRIIHKGISYYLLLPKVLVLVIQFKEVQWLFINE